MMKTQDMIMLGAVGVAGIIGYSILSAKPEEERFAGFGIPSLGQVMPSFDLSGLFAGLEFPDIITTVMQPVQDLGETILKPITDFKEGIDDVITGTSDTFADWSKGLFDLLEYLKNLPKETSESLGEGAKILAQDLTEAIVTISPFGWGEEMGKRLPVGTWLGDMFNWLKIEQPFAPPRGISAPEYEEKTRQLLEARKREASAGLLTEIAGRIIPSPESATRGQARPSYGGGGSAYVGGGTAPTMPRSPAPAISLPGESWQQTYERLTGMGKGG